MAETNPRWGAPRMHGELLKLGIDVCQATVAKYMARPRTPPSQTWRTFLSNHVGQIVAADFFVVPTVTFRVFVLVLLAELSARTFGNFAREFSSFHAHWPRWRALSMADKVLRLSIQEIPNRTHLKTDAARPLLHACGDASLQQRFGPCLLNASRQAFAGATRVLDWKCYL
jgi:hypothetical protein